MPAATVDRGPTASSRPGLRVLTGLAIASAATLIVTVVWAYDGGSPAGPGDAGLVRVGVVEGQSVPAYLSSSHRELDRLLHAAGQPAGTPTWALVSLTGYHPPDRLAAVLGGAAVAQVYARVPLPAHPRTPVVRIPVYRMPDDVVAGMLAAATRRDREQADYRQLSAGLTGDDENVARIRRAYAAAASTAAAEAGAFRAHCACVFAAVVRADPVTLGAIARRLHVRAVDPAPEVLRLDRAEFRPPLPDQRTTVPAETRSATAPAPGDARPVAPATATPLPSSTGAVVTPAAPDGPGAGPGRSAPASEDLPAVPSAPVTSAGDPVVPSAVGASRGASRRQSMVGDQRDAGCTLTNFGSG